LTQTTNVKARILNGSDWSPVIDVVFTVSQAPNIQLTEIMYHPPDDASNPGTEYEFLEFKNTGSSTVNMSGMTISGGASFTFPGGTNVAPNNFALVVSNQSAFNLKYPGTPVTGVYTGHLGNDGDTVTLKDIGGTTIVSCTYSDRSPWPTLPDGSGNSLVPVDPSSNPDPNNPANWRASTNLGGSPGQDDPAPTTPAIVVNEVLTNSVAPQTDAVELYNPTNQPADISRWFLSDSSTTPKKFQIPNPTIIPANGYVVFTENDFNPAQPVGNNINFAFDSHGEEVRLSAADSTGNLTGYSDGFSFGASNPGVSFGRYINNESSPRVTYPAQKSQTFGAANSGQLIGPVVMTEMMYHPVSKNDEFIELRNISHQTVPLYDPANPSDTWRIDGFGFSFPANTSLAPGQIIIVSKTMPPNFSVPSAINVYGPTTGSLDNSERRSACNSRAFPTPIRTIRGKILFLTSMSMSLTTCRRLRGLSPRTTEGIHWNVLTSLAMPMMPRTGKPHPSMGEARAHSRQSHSRPGRVTASRPLN
jgi:Lamin Tail Domain